MRWLALGMAAICLTAGASTAIAADCALKLPETGRAIELKSPLDELHRQGLAESLLYGLSDATHEWPVRQISSAPACPLDSFEARGSTYTLSGGTGELPPRWATTSNGGWMAYLALAPSLEEAYEVGKSGAPSSVKVKHAIYVLVVTSERMRHVVRLYDGLPDPATLRADMAAALEGRLPLIADFDPDSGAVSFAASTISSARAVLRKPLPGEGGSAARITAPDGIIFTAAADGAVAMAGSRFVCPAAFASLNRMDMWIANATESQRDLACRYIASSGWISIFVTRLPDRPSARQVFDRYVSEAHAASPSMAAATAKVPLAAGDRPKPAYADAWIDSKGLGQAIWLSAMGDWYVEVRATYEPDDQDQIGDAAAAIFAEAFKDIDGGS